MEYRVTFYRTESGDQPVVEFLESLRHTNEPLHKPVTAGIRKLKHRDNHGRPLTAPVGEAVGIVELRVGHADIARVFFFFREGREIVCTHGYVKKRRKLDPAEIDRAMRYRADRERRCPADSKQRKR